MIFFNLINIWVIMLEPWNPFSKEKFKLKKKEERGEKKEDFLFEEEEEEK